MMTNDLKGIKNALKFLIERALMKELDDKLTTILTEYPNSHIREDSRKEIIKNHNEKYKKLLDELK